MRKLFSLIFCVLLISSIAGASARTLAIKPFDSSDNVEASMPKNASNLLFTKIGQQIEKNKQYKLIATADIEKILEEQKKQFEGCYSDECGIKLGKLLSANVIIMGSIGRFENDYVFNIRMVNIESSQSEKTSSAKCKSSDYEDFEKAIEKLAIEILDVSEAIQTGSLEITSNPSNAEIFINGVKTDKKTPVVLALEPGFHSILAINEGYGPKEFSIEIKANEKTNCSIEKIPAGYVKVKILKDMYYPFET